MVTLLRALFKFAQDIDVAVGNPAVKLKRPKYTPAPATILKGAEIVRLIENADEPWRTIILLGAFTGMRRGEIAGLAWQDISFADDTIRIARQFTDGAISLPKTTAGRRVLFMSDQVKAALRDLAARAGEVTPDDFLFPPETSERLLYHLRRAAKKAGLPRIRFHDLRHCAATLMIEAGNDPRAVQDTLGHASSKFTMEVYTHVMDESRRKVAATMTDALPIRCLNGDSELQVVDGK
jgi:integrase